VSKSASACQRRWSWFGVQSARSETSVRARLSGVHPEEGAVREASFGHQRVIARSSFSIGTGDAMVHLNQLQESWA
jgi:hypothetical protein